MIEQVSNEKLDEREKYWIEYYNSYFDGYNSTLGGRTTQLYNWDIDDIIEKYLQLKSARKVAQVLGCDHSSIDAILNANGVHRFTQAEQKARSIIITKGDFQLIFPNSTEAAKWFMNNGYTKSTNRQIVRQGITSSILKGQKKYGFNISYEE